MLTSLDEAAAAEVGFAAAISDQVERLTTLAQTAGLDGVVASPQEIAVVRRICGDRFTIVTPGIRGPADRRGDQHRTLSAPDALAAGASYLVVGRPILAARDPRLAAEQLAQACGSSPVT
jgi:orotidine-5'-phosphate decarboxylase